MSPYYRSSSPRLRLAATLLAGITCLLLIIAPAPRVTDESVSKGTDFSVADPTWRADDTPTLPAEASEDWWTQVSRSLAEVEYRTSESAAGLQAPNRAQNLRTYFRDGSIELLPRESGASDWCWTWRTIAWGRVSGLAMLPSTSPRVDAVRVEYRHEGLVEWYENAPAGLEQGFTIAEAPAGEGPLCIAGEIAGDLEATFLPGADEIDFLAEGGALALRYGELHAWDASGRELPGELAMAEGGTIHLLIDDANAVYPVVIDPIMTAPSWTGDGTYTNSSFGYSVSTAGDINGDGYSDVVVGAPNYDGGLFYEGCVRVYLGSASGLSVDYHRHYESNQQNAFFGWSVSTAGDVNGDGYDDIVAGAKWYDDGFSDNGRVEVYYGSADGLGWTEDWDEAGEEYNAAFGWSVSTAGDVDGDGYDDVIIGAKNQETNDFMDGKAYVFMGSAAGLEHTPDWTAHGVLDRDHFGHCVSWAGDVNGDGYDDVIVGNDPDAWITDDPGYAKVYHGSASGLNAGSSWGSYDPDVDSEWGWAVAGAGDVNGDGYADVLVSSPLFDNGAGQGRVVVYHGSATGLETTAARTYDGDQVGARFGNSVASAGDPNGDGYSDILIGAPEYDYGQVDEGFVWLYLGYYDGLATETDWYKDSDQTGAFYGWSVATAGDVNGDGYSDILVGAHYYDHPEEDEGCAFCYHGGSYGPRDMAGWVTESNQASAQYGWSVACAGDANADGYSDVLVGAPVYDNGEDGEGAAFLFPGSHLGLSWVPTWWAESNQVGAMLGISVAGAGDVNGDGYSDLLIGAYEYTENLTEEGAAFLWLHEPGAPYGNPGNAAWTGFGGQEYSDYGRAVAGGGDVNGDGYADIAVGAPDYDDGQIDEGYVFAYFGSETGPSADADWTHGADFTNAHYGRDVALNGDFNGDGFSDVLVGAPNYYVGEIEEGYAFVYIGSAEGPQPGAPWWNCKSNEEDAHLGWSVAYAGDVNGDGFSDVLVGAPFMYPLGTDGGAAFLWEGDDEDQPNGTPANADWSASRGDSDSFFGYAVSSAGDINSDGYSDIILGGPREDLGVGDDAGGIYVYLGSSTGLHTGAADWYFLGVQDGAQLGNDVCSVGDVNGDGFADILAGARYHDAGQSNEGRAYLFYGNESRGLARTPQQWQSDLSEPIGPFGLSDSETAFALKARGRTPAGRGHVRMEYEVEPFGTAFDGSGTVFGDWTDTGAPDGLPGSVVDLTELVSGFGEGSKFHWRLRLWSDDPHFPRTPWFYLPYNGAGEMDLRTRPESTPAPVTPAAALRLASYPNPFNPKTTLTYSLAVDTDVELSVHDVQGRLLRTLVDGVQPAGERAVVWDGRDEGGRALPSGVYFARLRAGELIQGGKLILVK